MKTFTLDEANELLLEIKPKLLELKTLYAVIGEYRLSSRNASHSSQYGGGMPGGSDYVNKLFKIGQLATEIADEGIELKDYSRGLIDFPAERNGRTVYLCWEIEDVGEIRWWHEIDDGYAGRQPI
ncbi:MAG TPA: DUF2203 domain-containing protein [Pyrinomonadaceae bacterium]|nr:DUF2203 domain-containing protein [Pyrinomonadaceae bacterium]